jgi:branched-subunit amino acid ABC-type transport system permease component
MKKAPTFLREDYTEWMTWLLALVLKPFIAVAFFMLAWMISRVIWRYLPESKLKTILFSPLPGHRKR